MVGSSWNVCRWRFKHYQKPTVSSRFLPPIYLVHFELESTQTREEAIL
jgi:hypothetical protein